MASDNCQSRILVDANREIGALKKDVILCDLLPHNQNPHS
jgi:hypothetical protein